MTQIDISGTSGARAALTTPAVHAGRTRPATLAEIFTATCERAVDALALDALDARLSYLDLDAASYELASRLHAAGISRGDRVVVHLQSGTAELYTAILGVLRAGAAYVPIDVDDPPARVDQIRADSGACAQIVDGLVIELLAEGGATPRGDIGAPRPQDDAWIIFTSGSTGRPKGVAVTHRAAAAFVAAETRLFTVTERDRVLAGLSVGFDASCEEIWLAWAHGAALVPAPRDLVRAGVELGSWLLNRNITVVSTVPTLAALWDESCLHQVRLLILGGEACPDPLGWRLAAGREVWNTYGPTEATVVSTAAPIVPGQPVTIGRPLDGWQVAVLDGDVPAQAGNAGELVIGGVGLGRYLDPALDAERYAGIPALGWSRAYRTGDIVVETPGGLHFVGRSDDQVKIGGRRIELGEIEGALLRAPGVSAAAVAVRESAAGNKLLVGYVVGRVDPAQVRAFAGRVLPAGIVPVVVTVDSLPRASSGKVDRKSLPWPVGGDRAGLSVGIGADGKTLTDTEAWLAERWMDQLGPVEITVHSDFFALGGTSLAAAKLISVLRERYPAVAIADLYNQPTLRELAARLSAVARDATVTDADAAGARARSWAARRLGALQILGVVALMVLRAIPWLLGTLAYGNLEPIGTPHVSWVWLAVAALALASPPARVLLQVACTRVLLRGLRPGRYPRYSLLAFRLWFVQRLAEVTKFDRLGGTPWAARYARMAGAAVGAGARLATVPPAGALVRIGPGATIEAGVDMEGWWIDGEEVVVGTVEVGADARVGARSMLEPGSVVGSGAEVQQGSVVSGTIPAGELWGGVPAVRIGAAGEGWPAQAAPRGGFGTVANKLLFAASFPLTLLLAALVIAPSILVVHFGAHALPRLDSSPGDLILAAVIFTVVTIPVEAVAVALATRLVWKLVRPGLHPEYAVVGWALWFSEQLRQSSMTQLFPLYASLFTRPWMRLMGVDIGRRTEISVTTGLNPLVRFGEFGQCTDDIGFCGVSSRDGWIKVEPISVGDRTFLGPGAILRGGTQIGDDSLIGVMTMAPERPADGTSWLGIPALELPRVADRGDVERTVAPPRSRIAARAGMDTLRLLVPNTVVLLIDLVVLYVFASLCAHDGLLVAALLTPLLLLAGGLTGTLVMVAMKWTLIGRYRRSEHPLWSWFVWRDEMINTAQEQLSGGMLVDLALGTPLMSLYLRALGARVGAGVWTETLAVTEYDMIDLRDGAAVNRGACLMTHLFHDRLLRIGPARIGAGAALLPIAAVLPDTVVGAGTTVGPHSVVMRGEELPAGTQWHGVPVSAA